MKPNNENRAQLFNLEFNPLSEEHLLDLKIPNTYGLYDNVNERSSALNKYLFSNENIISKDERKQKIIDNLDKETKLYDAILDGGIVDDGWEDKLDKETNKYKDVSINNQELVVPYLEKWMIEAINNDGGLMKLLSDWQARVAGYAGNRAILDKIYKQMEELREKERGKGKETYNGYDINWKDYNNNFFNNHYRIDFTGKKIDIGLDFKAKMSKEAKEFYEIGIVNKYHPQELREELAQTYEFQKGTRTIASFKEPEKFFDKFISLYFKRVKPLIDIQAHEFNHDNIDKSFNILNLNNIDNLDEFKDSDPNTYKAIRDLEDRFNKEEEYITNLRDELYKVKVFNKFTNDSNFDLLSIQTKEEFDEFEFSLNEKRAIVLSILKSLTIHSKDKELFKNAKGEVIGTIKNNFINKINNYPKDIEKYDNTTYWKEKTIILKDEHYDDYIKDIDIEKYERENGLFEEVGNSHNYMKLNNKIFDKDENLLQDLNPNDMIYLNKNNFEDYNNGYELKPTIIDNIKFDLDEKGEDENKGFWSKVKNIISGKKEVQENVLESNSNNNLTKIREIKEFNRLDLSNFGSYKDKFNVVGTSEIFEQDEVLYFKTLFVEQDGVIKKIDYEELKQSTENLSTFLHSFKDINGFTMQDFKSLTNPDIELNNVLVIKESFINDIENRVISGDDLDNNIKFIFSLYSNTLIELDANREIDAKVFLSKVWERDYVPYYNQLRDKENFIDNVNELYLSKMHNLYLGNLGVFVSNSKVALKKYFDQLIGRYSEDAKSSDMFSYKLTSGDELNIIDEIFEAEMFALTEQGELPFEKGIYNMSKKYKDINNNSYFQNFINTSNYRKYILGEKLDEDKSNVEKLGLIDSGNNYSEVERHFRERIDKSIAKVRSVYASSLSAGADGSIIINKLIDFYESKLNIGVRKNLNPYQVYLEAFNEQRDLMIEKHGESFFTKQTPIYYKTLYANIALDAMNDIDFYTNNKKDTHKYSNRDSRLWDKLKQTRDIIRNQFRDDFNNNVFNYLRDNEILSPEMSMRHSSQMKGYRANNHSPLVNEIIEALGYIAEMASNDHTMKFYGSFLNPEIAKLDIEATNIVTQQRGDVEIRLLHEENLNKIKELYTNTINKLKTLKVENLIVENNVDREKFVKVLQTMVDMTLIQDNKEKIVDLTKYKDLNKNIEEYEKENYKDSFNKSIMDAIFLEYSLHMNEIYKKRDMLDDVKEQDVGDGIFIYDISPYLKYNKIENRDELINSYTIKSYDGSHIPIFMDKESKTIWSVEWTSRFPMLNIYIPSPEILYLEANQDKWENFCEKYSLKTNLNDYESHKNLLRFINKEYNENKDEFDEIRREGLNRIRDIYSLIQANYFIQLEQDDDKSMFLNIDPNMVREPKPKVGAIPFMTQDDYSLIEGLDKFKEANINIKMNIDIFKTNPFNYQLSKERIAELGLVVQLDKLKGYNGELASRDKLYVPIEHWEKEGGVEFMSEDFAKGWSFAYEVMYGFDSYLKNRDSEMEIGIKRSKEQNTKLSDTPFSKYYKLPNLIKIFETKDELENYKKEYNNILNREMKIDKNIELIAI